MLSENQFKPIIDNMQSSVYFKKIPLVRGFIVKEQHVKIFHMINAPEKDYRSFCAFSGSQHKNEDVLQHHEEQGTSGYQINTDDKRRQR